MFESLLDQLGSFSQVFTRHGKQIFLVGGAIRNLLLGRPVTDYDFTTDALPEEVQGFFKRVLPTGLRHGTVTVLFQGQSYEVTTFRVDGDYSDGRRPDHVQFTPSLEQDLDRRDFTINALALDLENGTLIDFHGGQADLQDGVLRAIGDPGLRFDEDSLRLLRLFRFASQLGFDIETNTLDAIPSRRSKLATVSRERIREELIKSMAGDYPARAFRPLFEMGILSDIFMPIQLRALTMSTLERLDSLSRAIRWSFWLTVSSPFENHVWETTLRRLTFSNSEVAGILGPAQALTLINASSTITSLAKAIIAGWGSLERIDSGVEYLASLEAEGWWTDQRGLIRELARVSSTEEPIFLADLAVNGQDLIREGVNPGPRVGDILRTLQKQVWENPELNSPSALLEQVKALL